MAIRLLDGPLDITTKAFKKNRENILQAAAGNIESEPIAAMIKEADMFNPSIIEDEVKQKLFWQLDKLRRQNLKLQQHYELLLS